MSMLLLIRSADDLRSAVEAANDFLVYQRQRVAEPRLDIGSGRRIGPTKPSEVNDDAASA